MSKLNLKRSPRIKVETSAGEVALRPLNALDLSQLVKEFDLETVELTTRIINHVQSGKPVVELLTDANQYMDLLSALPDLIASAINLCAGGDTEDLQAIRELPMEDFALLTAKMVSHSLDRIGGLGNFLDLVTEAASKTKEAFDNEIQKRQGTNTSPASGEALPS